LTSIHDKAVITAEAAEAAGAQGKFWEMHDLIYEHQRDWAGLPANEMIAALSKYAQDIEIDVAQFSSDLETGKYREVVNQAYESAAGLGLGGTPTLFVNGQLYEGPRSDFYLIGLIRLFNYAGPQYDAPPPLTVDTSGTYFATFETSQGTFCAELFADKAPQTVNSFVFLANEGFYDGISFHRVLPDFVVQTGDPTGGGFGGPGYRFDDEFDPDLRHDAPGMLSMANAGANTNGSQFFITLRAVPDLDDKHAIFGQVIEGWDVVESLMPRDPQEDPYAPADTLIAVTIGDACGM
jgi:cyclophilin family peptidyl-prolyl cis-trans isomerase